MTMEVTNIGRSKLIAREGRRNYAYPDPASPLAKRVRSKYWGYRPARDILANYKEDVHQLSGAPWTCGIGATGKDINIDTKWSDREVDRRFKEHLTHFSDAVNKLIKIDGTTASQFDAMVSLAFNIGVDAFAKSTALRKHNAGDFQAASRAFKLFNMAQGKVNDGLVARRADESAQYLSVYDEPSVPLPATPDAERPLVKSEINIAAATTALTTGTAAVGSILDVINGRELTAILVVATLVCGAIIYWRWKQRDGGWA